MSQATGIEWTDATWNPVRGCSRVSEGCRNCYAERVAARFSTTFEPDPGGMGTFGRKGPFYGFAERTSAGPRWTGHVELIPEKLDEPLRWKKPRRVFVNSMSDLFHERLSDEAIAAVFGAMAACQHHTFQVLTKRPERMLRWFGWAAATDDGEGNQPLERCMAWALSHLAARHAESIHFPPTGTWPLPNVWLGVSVEDQASFDERVLPLVSTPAALRFISYEPALGALDCSLPVAPMATPLLRPRDPKNGPGCVHWLIVGGESGPSARPFDIAWARSAVAQCKAAGVPVFVKQLGARPLFHSRPGEPGAAPCNGECCRIFDRKGGDPSEWPEDLRVREFPEPRS